MLKRGLYFHDDPKQGYVPTPLALNHISGGYAEKISTTILKEAQEELQIFLMGRSKGSDILLYLTSYSPDLNPIEQK